MNSKIYDLNRKHPINSLNLDIQMNYMLSFYQGYPFCPYKQKKVNQEIISIALCVNGIVLYLPPQENVLGRLDL